MKKYILLLISYIISVITISGQIENNISNIFTDSLRKNIDRNNVKISIKKTDTVFTYIPQKSKRESPVTTIFNAPKNTKSISSYDLSFIPNSFNVDTSRDVGEINIIQSTNNKGSLIYTIPIQAYDNLNVNSPPIQIVYNSMSENSIAGKGWQIAGLSAIMITNSTLYHDGKVTSGKRNKSSAFSLDGNRLINLNNGTSTTINYETEFGQIKVTATLVNNEIAYFTVKNPDGTIGIYGYSNNAKTNECYPLTEIRDLQANYATFTYERSKETYYVKEISYGGRKIPISNHFAKIVFTYEERPDKDLLYVDGLECILDKRLKEVSSYVNNQVFRTYQFTYDFNNISLLKRIDCKSNNRYLNPITFYYGKNNKIIELKKTQTLLSEAFSGDIILRKGNFDTTTNTDALIVYPKKNSYGIINTVTNKKGEIVAYQYGSQFHPDEALLIYDDVTSGASIPTVLKAGEGFIQLIPMDIDGDGIDELVKMNSSLIFKPTGVTSGYYYEKIIYTVYDVVRSLGKTYAVKRYDFSSDYGDVVNCNGYRSSSYKAYFVGDFLGDGKQNILSITYNKNIIEENITSRATLVDITGKKKSPTHDKTCFSLSPDDNIYAFDVDGDGKTDLCHANESGVKIYTFDTSGNLVEMGSYDGMRRIELKKRQVFIADINGDGKLDLLTTPSSDDYTVHYRQDPCGSCTYCKKNGGGVITPFAIKPPDYPDDGNPPPPPTRCLRPIYVSYKVDNPTVQTWLIYYSTGTSFKRDQFYLCKHTSVMRYVLQDMNGDNKADLVVYNGADVKVYLSKNGKIDPQVVTTHDIQTSYLVSAGVHNASNMNQLFLVNGLTLYPMTFSVNQSEEQLLTGVVTSHGVINKNVYANLKDPNVNYYDKGADCAYPYRNLDVNLNLFVGTETYYNNILQQSVYYKYKKGVVELQGRGFLGFETVTAEDRIRNTTTVSTYNPLKFGELVKEDSPKETITYTYNHNVAANRITKVTLKEKTQLNKLNNVTITTENTYDAYTNLTREIVRYGNNITTFTYYTYNNHTSPNYKLGLLNSKEVYWQREGVNYVEKEYISAFTTTYLPSTVVYTTNGKQTAEVQNTYDANGLLTKQSWKHFGATTKQVTQYEYDASRRVTKKTDPIGLYTTYGYDSKGQLITEKNHLQHAITHEYDSWGRLTKSVKPNGEIVTNASTWNSSIANARYLNQTTVSGQPSSRIFYDGLNRELRKGATRFDGKYLYVDYVYNNKGLMGKTSLPFTGSSPTKWDTYTYDKYDRPFTVQFASGRKDSCSYLGFKTITFTDGIKKELIFDNQGNLTSVSDPAGLTTYALRPDGKPNSVTSVGVTTTFEYDAYGRQTAIIDPSAGKKTFTYDAAGNLSQEVDARGKAINLSYDANNRLIKKEFVGEQTITYKYNANNFLESEISTNGTSKVYTPDALLRIKTIKETGANNNWLQKDYTYSFGNISDIAYSSNTGNITTETYKYQNGNLLEILSGTTSIWKLSKENEMGLASEIKNDNTILVQTFTFDEYGLPKTSVVKNKSNVTIQNYAYNFNSPTGNLVSRKDNKRNIQENFTYDHLHRLTTFSGKSISYDDLGNITKISNIGSFLYSQAKPYAVEYITPIGTEYMQRAQLITYNAMMLPTSITENGYTSSFAYNGNGDKVRMEIKKGNTVELARHYIGGRYEKDSGVAGAKEKLYIGGDAYTAAAVLIKEGTGNWNIHYICRDYLGNITQITDASGNLKQELSYDPYGRLRNPENQTLYAMDDQPTLLLGRGFTGHEHLPWFGLINMNARLFDPVLCRFLSPDPYVMSATFSQAFNRFSYCLNNPFRFTDPTGKFPWLAIVVVAAVFATGNLITSAIAGDINSPGDGLAAFFTGAVVGAALALTWMYLPAVPYVGKVLFATMKYYAIAQAANTVVGVAAGLARDAFNGFKDLHGLVNSLKIFGGNFYFNNRGLRGVVEGYLRHTYESITNFSGYFFSQARNSFNKVDRVDYYEGATFVTNENSRFHQGVSLSGFINMNIRGEIGDNFGAFVLHDDPMFMHEYGHRKDSRIFGFLYLFAIGIPSIAGAEWTEIRANKNAKSYFSVNWNLYEDGYPTKKNK